MKIIALTSAITLLATAPSAAYLFCSEPSEPYCAQSYAGFSDGYEFEDCKREVEQYVDESRTYVECLSSAIDETLGEVEDVIESFNRRAGS